MAPGVLGTFAQGLSDAAKNRLETLGVEVRLDTVLSRSTPMASCRRERIASKTVIWTAGVAPFTSGKC